MYSLRNVDFSFANGVQFPPKSVRCQKATMSLTWYARKKENKSMAVFTGTIAKSRSYLARGMRRAGSTHFIQYVSQLYSQSVFHCIQLTLFVVHLNRIRSM